MHEGEVALLRAKSEDQKVEVMSLKKRLAATEELLEDTRKGLATARAAPAAPSRRGEESSGVAAPREEGGEWERSRRLQHALQTKLLDTEKEIRKLRERTAHLEVSLAVDVGYE